MIAENEEEEWLRGMHGLFVGREEKVGRVRSVCFCQISACGATPEDPAADVEESLPGLHGMMVLGI